MKPLKNAQGNVIARWVKRTYPQKTASELLQNAAYVMLHDFGSEKVLGFRKAIHEGEILPPHLDEVNAEELKICIAKQRRNENDFDRAEPSTLSLDREVRNRLGGGSQ